MVECCQCMGLFGEALVLCQLAPEQSLIRTGLQMIDSLRPSSPPSAPNGNGEPDISANPPTDKAAVVSLDCLDNMADFFWDLDLLEALTTLEFKQGSLSRRNTFMSKFFSAEHIVNFPMYFVCECYSDWLVLLKFKSMIR